MKKPRIDMYGRLMQMPDTAGMLAPYRCGLCSHVYDAADVEVKARYADCSMWDCPSCGRRVDDRQWTSLVTAKRL